MKSLLFKNRTYGMKSRHRGAMLPFFAIGMLGIIGVVGLAIDSSHAFVNSTRLQNALDAAALSAAKTLHQFNKNTALARADGTATFAEHLSGEMATGGATVGFEFSTTLNPFVAGGADPNFVRATSNNHTIGMYFAQVLPGVGNNWTIASTAVSGPIPLLGGEVCDLAPLLVCGDPNQTDFGLDYTAGNLQCLKYGAGTNNGNGGNGGNGNGNGGHICDTQFPDNPDGVGPGNYHLLRLGGNGANIVRENLAGGYQGCGTLGGIVETQPGNAAGPVRQGLNTRFGEYQGGGINIADYPPDLVINSPSTYSAYSAAYANPNSSFHSDGQEGRRILTVPIVNCAGIQNGQSQLPLLGFGCYFIRQKIEQGGQNSYIVGELIEECDASGSPGAVTPALGGPQKIILYNDPGNQAT